MSDNTKQDTKERQDQGQDENQDKAQPAQNQSLTDAEKSQSAQAPPPTWLEWAARVVSLVLVIGLLGYVIADGVAGDSPIEFDTVLLETEVERRGSSWVAPVDITNVGDTSVEDLVVTMTVDTAATSVSEDLSVPLLGAGGTVRGEFWFDIDPRTGAISFDINSYRVP